MVLTAVETVDTQQRASIMEKDLQALIDSEAINRLMLQS